MSNPFTISPSRIPAGRTVAPRKSQLIDLSLLVAVAGLVVWALLLCPAPQTSRACRDGCHGTPSIRLADPRLPSRGSKVARSRASQEHDPEKIRFKKRAYRATSAR